MHPNIGRLDDTTYTQSKTIIKAFFKCWITFSVARNLFIRIEAPGTKTKFLAAASFQNIEGPIETLQINGNLTIKIYISAKIGDACIQMSKVEQIRYFSINFVVTFIAS